MTNSGRARTTLHEQGGAGTVRVEDLFDTDVDDLWSAITDPDRLARWIATVKGDLRLGGRFHARFTSGWEGPGRVEVCEPPRRLVLAMAPGTDQSTVIEASLGAADGGTMLVVEERGLPLGELPFHGAGWQVHIEDLGSHIGGAPAEEWKPRWLERLPGFQRATATRSTEA
jgi:uncharacterized protein YndB with AHSA1/START domain